MEECLTNYRIRRYLDALALTVNNIESLCQKFLLLTAAVLVIIYNHWTAVRWQGDPGAPGPPGLRGPPGVDGLPGLQVLPRVFPKYKH